MKKQLFLILTLAVFIVSFSSSAFAQLAPRPVTCLTGDALHPIAGTDYAYTIDIPNITEFTGALHYRWFVTQSTSFINAGAFAATVEADGSFFNVISGSGYNLIAPPNAGSNTITLNWHSSGYDPTLPLFVGILVIGDNGVCSPNNMKVYKILPQQAFTLDIANLNAGATPDVAGTLEAGYGINLDKCIHDIVTATYDATAPEGVLYDFGVDYMFYEVVAANFSDSWKPSFTLAGIDAEETVTVEWDEDKNFTSPHAMTLAAGIWSSSDFYTAVAAGGNVGNAGESIYVRVTLDHTTTVNYEGLADEVVALAVDGITNLSAPVAQQLGDIHTVAGTNLPAEACPWVDGYVNDIATQTLRPRPAINAGAAMPAPGLLPVKP